MSIRPSLGRLIVRTIKEEAVVLTAVAIGLAVVAFPLQQHISLGRLQHYGLGLVCVGFGYIVQTVWSWKLMKRWTRIGHLTAGLYISAAALTIYSNPWLEPRMAVRTQEQENMRSLIACAFGFLAVPQAIICLLWIFGEIFRTERPKRK